MSVKAYIIILNWNKWELTAECINSLSNLTGVKYKLVVVDNGSSDNSISHLKELYPQLFMIKNEKNLGFGGGNNPGIEYALNHGAEYIWLLNNDTEVEKNTLSAMLEEAEKDSKIGAVGSMIYDINDKTTLQVCGGGHIHYFRCYAETNFILSNVDKLDYISGASILLRSKALQEIGLFDDNFFMYWEDVDLGVRLKKRGYRFSISSNAKVYHHESASCGGPNVTRDYYEFISALYFAQKYIKTYWLTFFAGFIFNRLVRRTLNNGFNWLFSFLKLYMKKGRIKTKKMT